MIKSISQRLKGEKQVVERFRQYGACSVEMAKPLHELEIHASQALYKLQRLGVIVHAGSNTYFLDDKQLMQVRLNRVKWVMIGLFIIILLLLWWVPRMK